MSIRHVTATWAEMVKLSHSVFALPFAVTAAFLAGRELPAGRPAWGQLALVVLCMVAARSVAMTFNRIVDADVDARNPRTMTRPIPAGRIGLPAAWTCFALAAAGFLLGCAGFAVCYDNFWPIGLAVPVLAYLCGYSLCKWFTRWSHFYLGSAIALSPLAAWLAVHPASVGWPAVILTAAVTLWIGGFDIIYACQDVAFDRAEGLHSLPARLGVAPSLTIARLAHGGTVFLLAALGHVAALGWLYWSGVAVVAVLLFVENAMVGADDLSRVNVAFFTLNGMVSLALGAVSVIDVLLGLSPPGFRAWLPPVAVLGGHLQTWIAGAGS